MTNYKSDIQFHDLFNLEDIQRLQDIFSDANGVASIITHPDGIPITTPSNFTHLCNNIIRKTQKGCANCYKSDAIIGRMNANGPIVQPCLSGGLWDAGASIIVGGKHLANWLIGQVRNEEIDIHRMKGYADEIGADKEDFMAALNDVPVMSVGQFNKVAKMLYAFANELSDKAYNNWLLKMQIDEGLKAKEALQKIEEKFLLMFENSPQPMFIVHNDTLQFIEVNQAFIEHYGYSREEFLRMTMNDIHYSNPDRNTQKQAETSNGLWYSTKEATHIKKNGEKIIVEVSFDSILYEKNNALLVLG